jgi:hypothetical protein
MNFAGILVISFLLAFVVSVAVEMPFVNLDKLLFAGDSKSLQSKQNGLFNYLQLKRGNFFQKERKKHKSSRVAAVNNLDVHERSRKSIFRIGDNML